MLPRCDLQRQHFAAGRGRNHGILHAANLQRRFPAESCGLPCSLHSAAGLCRYRHFRTSDRRYHRN